MRCELGYMDSDFDGAVNKEAQVRASGGANELSQVISANQSAGQDAEPTEAFVVINVIFN